MKLNALLDRRELVFASTLGLIGCASPWAMSHKAAAPIDPNSPYEQSRQRMREKFGDRGATFVIDAVAKQEFFGVEFFPEGSDYPIYAKSAQSLRTGGSMSWASIPERVRVIWREIDKPITGKYGQMTYEGPLTGDFTIAVGSRIPQEVVDRIKREGGGLRLKFRLHKEGVYFGWDIGREKKFDPPMINAQGRPALGPAEYLMEGGDFCEARVINASYLRKGWYIDQKTGIKIETDY